MLNNKYVQILLVIVIIIGIFMVCHLDINMGAGASGLHFAIDHGASK